MSRVTYDFKLLSSGIPGMSLVMSMNEEAFDFINDEDYSTISNGSAPVDNNRLSDFASLAEAAHLQCDFN
tara:strand:+ start:602 stop:811 length:210 start_codon:yes stop_codon:yes gene_type:complete